MKILGFYKKSGLMILLPQMRSVPVLLQPLLHQTHIDFVFILYFASFFQNYLLQI